ncbi:hypothetical protein [Phormidium sp. CCY1219]|uniref:hypothetical protein n=1 Tax=Phormidium sp. CCY1219 TaxID=2886104 RepID=UPI002D1F609B|nr:hypothetical protein [Phormidium sp. CCY1219]MEB3827696.1 hypothetical protein [Phormidium sp. CCY1219]
MQLLRSAIRRTLLFLTGLALLIGLSGIPPAWSLVSESDREVVVPASEAIADDFYAAGETVTINGTVGGDAILAGEQLIINGAIEGDLIAAGQTVKIAGAVGDDVRIAGQVLMLAPEARIGDDLVAAGLSLETQTGSTIGGNVAFMGSQALLAGTVGETAQLTTSALQVQGTVGGNLDAKVGGNNFASPGMFDTPLPIPEVPSGLTLAAEAQIQGNVSYPATAAANIAPEATIGGEVVVVKPSPPEEVSPDAGQVVWETLQRWIALSLVGLLLLWLVPDWTQNLGETARSRVLPSLGWGILTLVLVGILTALVIPALSLLLVGILGTTLSSLAPLVLGIALLAELILIVGFLIFVGYVPQVALGWLGGQWLLSSMQPTWAANRFLPLLLGLLLFVILTAIPGFGALLNLVIMLLGLGAFWIWIRPKLGSVF